MLLDNLKVSRYLEEVSFFDENEKINKTLLFSTRSSKLIYLDTDSWQNIKIKNFAKIDPLLLKKLEHDLILTYDDNEFATVLAENDRAIERNSILTMVLQPTAHCSLGCHYCGQKHFKDMLTSRLEKKIIEHIEQKIITGSYHILQISWFGAEPLSGIKSIRSLSPSLIALAQKHELHYHASIVTNGLSLNEKIAEELINLFQVTTFEITLDGTKEFHDKRRHTKSGKATFNQIYNNLLHLKNNYSDKIKLTIRSNIDDSNFDGVIPLIEQLHGDGFFENCNLYFAPIHSWGNDADQLVTSKKAWAELELEWFIKLKEKMPRLKLLVDRKKITCIALDKSAEVIDPYGKIYNCTEVSLVPTYEKLGENKHSLGHVMHADQASNSTREFFSNFSKEEELNNYPCHKCNIYPICGGACPKEWKEGRSPCPPMKYNLKERMMLEYIWNNN